MNSQSMPTDVQKRLPEGACDTEKRLPEPTHTRLQRDLVPAENPPIPFTGLSLAELDPARFTAAGLSPEEQASIGSLATSINYIISNLRTVADFLPSSLSIEPMRDALLRICRRMRRIFYCTDPVGYMLCDINTFIGQVRSGLRDLAVGLKAKGIENPSITEALINISEGLNFADRHLDELEPVMS